jgi:FMN-dependent NADH-azoreductase
MKKLLHINAAPRGEESRTLRVSSAFLEAFRAGHLDWVVEELNVFTEELPELTVRRLDGKYMLLGGKDLFGETRDAWDNIIAHIERFKSAEAYLLSTPMWNFSVPYRLKHYIDVIVQPGYMFRNLPGGGVEGFAAGKRMVVIASRGGVYASEETRPYDMQVPYLRTTFGFIGIRDITFVVAEPMDDEGPEGADTRERKLEEARRRAREVAEGF